MERSLDSPLTPRTAAYGHAFEHFVIAEIFRLNEYHRTDYKFSHYQSSAGGEIDLILSKGRKLIAIEIKSTSIIDTVEVRKMARICEAIRPTQAYFVSQDPTPSLINSVQCLPWQSLLAELFRS